MMTFEEFFKKKKIDLPLLQNGEPALFAEFERHYAQMGEKSFDHTKKYWFNQLRRRFLLPPEVKAGKVIIENPLAEQTVTGALTEPTAPGAQTDPAKPAEAASQPKPNVGFKPRFKAGMGAKSVEDQLAISPEGNEDNPPPTEPTKPAVGFKPRFKASMVAKPPEENQDIPATEEKADTTPAAQPEKPTAPVLGFKPKFKATVPPKPIVDEPAPSTEPEAKAAEASAEAPPKPMGFKPRFNAAKMKPKEPGEE